MPPVLSSSVVLVMLAACVQELRPMLLQAHPEHYTPLLDGLRLSGPFFDQHTATNVTAQAGTRAYLPCTVHQLMDKSVSWVRNRDSHILTVDRYSFIADARFQCFHPEGTDSWTLQIKYVQEKDAGLYECQVSTEPKISRTVQLSVVVPRVEIVGGMRDMYVDSGSTATIRCAMSQIVSEPSYTFWYQNSERVVSDGGRRRWLPVERLSAQLAVSTLVIERAEAADSGNYSCVPANLPSASVILHVLNGEQQAAMQDGVSGAPSPPGARTLTTLYLALEALALWLCVAAVQLPLAALQPQVANREQVVTVGETSDRQS